MRSKGELPSLQRAVMMASCSVSVSEFSGRGGGGGGAGSDELPLSLLWIERDPTDLMPLKSGLCVEERQLDSCKHPVLKQQRCSVTRSEGYAKRALWVGYPETTAEVSGNLQ